MRRDDRIEIEREMTFGETFSNTFIFLRENGAPLLKSILFIAGPFILLSAILLGVLFPGYFNLSGNVDAGPFMDGTYVETVAGKNTLRLIFFLLCTSLISMVTFTYMHLYTQVRDRDITLQEVWDKFRRNFFRLMGAKFIMWIIIALMTNCIGITGVIGYVLLGATELIILEKQAGPFDAIGQSWGLMKQYWGSSFGLILVMGIMIIVFWGLIEIPAQLLEQVEWFTTVSEDETIHKTATVIHAIAQILAYLLFLIPTVGISLRYYSVKEEHYRQGIIARIRTIGRALEEEDIYKEDEQY